MNSTAGFNQALKMSASGTFGQDSGKKTKQPAMIQEEDEDDEEAAFMKAIAESEKEAKRMSVRQ